MVKVLYKEGIEVILDVVFNYIGEGNENGLMVFFWGLENLIYYILEGDYFRYYSNYSGCGNIFNINNFFVYCLIVDCFCYWVREMYVDGFWFDLVFVMFWSMIGDLLEDFFVLWVIEFDLVLVGIKIIVEVWDVVGFY